jgi:hypothetical protein
MEHVSELRQLDDFELELVSGGQLNSPPPIASPGRVIIGPFVDIGSITGLLTLVSIGARLLRAAINNPQQLLQAPEPELPSGEPG